MRGRFAAVLTVPAIAFVPATAGASQQHSASAHVAKHCSAGFTHARIGGAQKCLRRAEFCARRYKTQYRRYAYRCVAGRLR